VGKAVKLADLIETYGVQLVRDLRVSRKLGGVYEDIHPLVAARFKRCTQPAPCQNNASGSGPKPDAGENAASGSQIQYAVPWFSRSDDGRPLRAGASTQEQQPRSVKEHVMHRYEEGTLTYDDWFFLGSPALPPLEKPPQGWIGNVGYQYGTGPYQAKPIKRMRTA